MILVIEEFLNLSLSHLYSPRNKGDILSAVLMVIVMFGDLEQSIKILIIEPVRPPFII